MVECCYFFSLIIKFHHLLLLIIIIRYSLSVEDEGTLHLGEKRPIRDAPDPVSRAHNVAGMTNGPSNGQLNILGIKVINFIKLCNDHNRICQL